MTAIHKTEVYSVLRERDHLGDPDVDGKIILNGPSGSRIWGYGLD
jgi:hypothetical protein